ILVSLVGLIAVLPGVLPSIHVQAQGATTTYTVQPGDNLFRISLKFGVTVAAIAQANNIAHPHLIFVGHVLIIPHPGSTPATTTAQRTNPDSCPGHRSNYLYRPAGRYIEQDLLTFRHDGERPCHA